MVTLPFYLILSAILFTIGLIGILIRKNVLIVLMCIELMLSAVNINLAAFSNTGNNILGQVFAIFIISISAAEAAVGLAIILVFYRQRRTIGVDELNTMKW